MNLYICWLPVSDDWTSTYTLWKMEMELKKKKKRNIEILDKINAIVRVCMYVFLFLHILRVSLSNCTNFVHFEVVHVFKNECKQMTIQIHSLYKMCNSKRNGTEQNFRSHKEKKNEYLFIIIFKTVLPIRVKYYVRFLNLKFHSS